MSGPAAEDRTTPQGLLRCALEHFAAALAAHDVLANEDVGAQGAPAAPVYQMCARAIELALRAYLGARGDGAMRAAFSLTELDRAARAEGLALETERALLLILDQMHASGRYRAVRPDSVTLLGADELFSLTGETLGPALRAIDGGWRLLSSPAGAHIVARNWLNLIEIKRNAKDTLLHDL